MTTKLILSVALLAFSLAGSADTRSLSVQNVHRDAAGRIVSVDLALSTGPSAVLYVAWGASDGGDVRADWDVYRPVARISGATTSHSYVFPARIADSVGSARFFLLDDYDVRVDKQYECIKTDGSQYVWTSFAPSGLSAIEMELSLQKVDASVALFASRKDQNNKDSITAFYIANSGWRFDYFGVKSAVPPLATADTKYLLRADPNGLSLNGSSISTQTPYVSSPGNPLLLFGACYGRDGTPQYLPSLTLFSLKAWPTVVDGDVLALDLVPGEINGVVGLYNKMDGSFLTSESAGHPLVAGAEVAVARANLLSQTGTLEGRLGAERTIRISAKRRAETTRRLSSVDLAFTTGPDRMLYVVWGATDGGAGIAGWQHYRKLADVAGDVTSYSFDIPDSWGDDVKFLGFRFCDAEYIPCEARYEGVAVDGAYVATDFTPKNTSQIDMSLSFATVSDSQNIFCARKQSQNSLTVFYIANTGWRLDYYLNEYDETVTAEAEKRYDLKLKVDGLYVNKSLVASVPDRYWSEFAAASPLALFVASYGDPTQGSAPFKGTFYSFRALESADNPDSVVLDLIPCLKNGVVCLYNLANGNFLDFGKLNDSSTITPVGFMPLGTVVAETLPLGIDASGLVLTIR